MESKRPSIPLERMALADMLGCVEPFVTCREDELAQLASSAVRVRKAAGAPVIPEGQVPDGLYVVLRGRVNLVRAGDGGRDIILSCLGPGEVFGEGCVLGGVGSSTAAVAAVATDLARVAASAVSAHIERNPATLVRLMRTMGERLREVESIASGLALCDVEERLRRTLARLARRQSRQGPSSEGWILAPVPTQSELARMVGSCRETVSRTLSSMARSGLLTASGRRMILDDRLMAEPG